MKLHEYLDGGTLLALQLVGLTEEEWQCLYNVARVGGLGKGYALVWHSRPAKTTGKFFYIVHSEGGDPIRQAKHSLRPCNKSEHWLVVMVDGRVPYGAEIKPEWREESCNTKS